MTSHSVPLRERLAAIFVPLAATLMIAAWLTIAPPGILGKLDAIGYAVCHRIEERSFHVDGQALPVCARCSGMYLGAVIGLAYQAIRAPRRSGMPSWKTVAPLGLFFVAFALDGSNSYLYLLKSMGDSPLSALPNLYTPNNTLRLFTGMGAGLAIAVALYPTFNQSVWKNFDPRPAMPDLKTLGGLLLIGLAAAALVLSEWDVVLYPAAFLSAGGVLLLLTMVYSILWMMLMRQENSVERLPQLGLPALAGLTIALIQITAIDLGRLWLTGTWGGFPLP